MTAVNSRMHPADLPTIAAADLAAAPVERAETIPSSWYTDPRFEHADREWILTRSWQGIGHAAQVAEAGQHFIASIAGEPVIVVRGKDRKLRAFFNVCRHRGGPLALEAGCANALQCKYHGWTYLLDGTLRGVPAMDRTELFDRKDFGLVPIRVEVWEGLVFVNLDPAAEPLAQFVGGIAERIAPIRLGGLTFTHRAEYEVRCNWKVYVDNFLEGYHVPYVHPELARLYDYSRYVTEVHPWYSLQHAPLTGDNLYSQDGGGEAFYYCIFPNFMLNILPGRLQTNLVLPEGPDRCRVVFQYFHAETTSTAAQQKIEADVSYSDAVQQEDIGICERVQQGLNSRAYDRGRFSVRYEAGVHHFQELVRKAYRLGSSAAQRLGGSALIPTIQE